MWKYIWYKEWIKLKGISILLLVLGLIIIMGIFATVRHDLIITDAQEYWYSIVSRNYQFFSVLKFVPLIIGILIGVAQFVPEIVDKRIKLTLHLPLNEETIVLKMAICGALVVYTVFAWMLLVFTGLGLLYFPEEIMRLSVVSLLPWFMSGVGAYFLTSLIVMEPSWKFRVLYALISAAFINFFYNSVMVGDYALIILPLFLLVLASGLSVLYSIHRFRKGEI